LINDHLGRVEPDQVDLMLERAQRHGTPLLELELRRQVGLARRDPEHLRLALGIAENCGAVVRLARLHHELGEMTGDGALSERGLSELEQLGDVDQLERYLVRRRSTATT
jgi:hypothetical protein